MIFPVDIYKKRIGENVAREARFTAIVDNYCKEIRRKKKKNRRA